MKLLVIFVQYDQKKYKNAFLKMKRYVDKFKHSKYYIIVDNKLNLDCEKKIDLNVDYINGDNAYREFSGWDRGLKYAKKKLIDYDVLLIINDSFMVYGWSILEKIKSIDYVNLCYVKNTVIGHLDSKGFEMMLFGYNVSSWICTNTVFLPKKAVLRIGKFTQIKKSKLNKVMQRDYCHTSYFKNSTYMSENYKNMVIVWLTTEWHGKMNITHKNWVFFKSKVLAMINESILTAQIRALKIKILPFSKLI